MSQVGPVLEPAAEGGGAAATNYKQLYRAMTTPQLIAEAWDKTEDLGVRKEIMTALMTRAATEGSAAWPSGPMKERDEMAGLYPDPEDPQFAARLFSKREFYEARAVAAGVADGTIDPCTSKQAERVFELTPVQRVVSRFMHPLTPYMGLLLFHGVGVGKTCSAVTIAEQFLAAMPQNKVIVLVPQALKENFKRTVFNPDALTWNAEEKVWDSRQCTGTSYLDRLGLRENPDLRAVTYKVEEDQRSRYKVTGYQAFANWIERTLHKSLPGAMEPAVRKEAENEILRRLFSDHLIIIDEAHNLRDSAADAAAGAGAVDTTGGEAAAGGEAAENAAGKALNPYLRRICLNAEGLRLVLMTATPMYNAAPEIILLLNYLILNDTKSEKSVMKVSDYFTKDGDLRPGKAQQKLEQWARRYVSYMRGENPFTFPLRMRPLASPASPSDMWPEVSATKNPVVLSEQERAAIDAMPLVMTEPVAGSPPERVLRAGTSRATQAAAEEAPAEEPKARDAMLDLRMQMANITYPNDMYGSAGWDNYFTASVQRGGENRLRTFQPKEQPEGAFNIDTVFSGEGLRQHAPKLHAVVESVKAARGICFAYSRYIKAGALPLAVALERAGFQRRLADGRLAPLLTDVPPVAAVCAICSGRAGAAHAADHPFKPACYVLLTSEDDISPKFAGLVKQAATWSDAEWGPLGSNVKVVIGSQVASEGLDLKCVREMHVIDAWYHLNRTDQIIGRAIRYCSHSALRAVEKRQGLPPLTLNNTLIYLHVLRVPDSEVTREVGGQVITEKLSGFETADMYAYRIAIAKALAVGRVQRVLKRHAWDCNIELEAITFTGLPPRRQIDAQGNERRSRNEAGDELEGYSPNDVDFTTYCDYERCRHECAIVAARTEAEGLHLDTSTFSVTDARRIILAKQDLVRRLFENDVMVPDTVVQDVFGDLPWEIASEALMELLDGRRFRLKRPDGVEGFLVKKAGYLVFQPMLVTDTEIPQTMRYARAFQLKRQFMMPTLPVLARAEEPGGGAAAPPPRPGPAAAAVAATEGRPVLVAAPAAEAPMAVATPAILTAWSDWYTWVSGGGAGAIPASVGAGLKIWSWILERYAAVPEARTVALRWWFDRCRYADQRVLLETVAVAPPADGPLAGLAAAVTGDLFRSGPMRAYRIYNPETMGVEYYCYSLAAAAGGGGPPTFTPCDSKIATIIERELNKPPVDPMKSTGPLFGFLAAKKTDVVFKTLDKTQPIKPSSVGAECGNTSNLSVHHPRVRILQAVGRDSDLAALMLPDSDESWIAEGAETRKRAGRPEHMKDITHQPLCLYLEFLCRILDARRVAEKRWFLTAAAAATAGLKGKK